MNCRWAARAHAGVGEWRTTLCTTRRALVSLWELPLQVPLWLGSHRCHDRVLQSGPAVVSETCLKLQPGLLRRGPLKPRRASSFAGCLMGGGP